MESTITIRKKDGTTDIWRCQEIGIDALRANERNTTLGEAFLFWPDFIPPSVAFDFASEKASGSPATARAANPALASAFRVDCGRQNPFDFRIGDLGAEANSKALRDIEPDHLRRILAQDLNYAKSSRRPLYQHIHQQIDGNTHECYRLLLPVPGGNRDITEIFGFCRPREPSRAPQRAHRRNEKSTQDR